MQHEEFASLGGIWCIIWCIRYQRISRSLLGAHAEATMLFSYHSNGIESTHLKLLGQQMKSRTWTIGTVYHKEYAHGFCFAVLCCGYTLTDFPISIRLTSPALWQSNDCPSASKATLMNMDKYFMWIHYERLHNHNKAKHNKTVCIFLGIYCTPIRMRCNSLRSLAVTNYWYSVRNYDR